MANSYLYDPNGRLVSYTDERGNRYDANHQYIGYSENSVHYDNNHQCIGYTDQNDNLFDNNHCCMGYLENDRLYSANTNTWAA